VSKFFPPASPAGAIPAKPLPEGPFAARSGRKLQPKLGPKSLLEEASEPAAPQAESPARVVEERPNPVQMLGLWFLGVYLISGFATDLSLHWLGSKPYLSTISGLIAAAAFVVSGAPTRALKSKIGRMWLYLTIWMTICIPFSRWPGGTVQMLEGYFEKAHCLLFLICALAVTLDGLSWLMYANLAGAFALLLECAMYGVMSQGRFTIPTSIAFNGPNDLALELAVCVGFFTFLIVKKGVVGRILGLGGLALAFYFMLRTGSRGSLVACTAMLAVLLLFSHFRMPLLFVSIPLLVIFLALSSDLRHRLMLIEWDPSEQAADAADQGSVGSQFERQELFKTAVRYTVMHPIFGIGPGQFEDAVWEDAKKEGKHVSSLGPHNSYVQISSECGLPGLFFFAAALVLSIRSNYRLYKQTRGDPRLEKIRDLAFCLFASIVVFGVNMIFHHVAYSSSTATLTGLSAALYLAAQPYLPAQTAPSRPR